MIPQNSAPRKSGGIIRTINGVRGIAILMVFCVHLVSIGFLPLGGPVAPLVILFWMGWTGVDLFFVLSGFLITGILLDTQESPNYFRSFYLRRILRIFPLYYLVVALGGIGFLLTRHTSHWHHFPSPATVGWLAVYLQNYHGVPPAFQHFWSLALEEQFYLIWPLIVYLVRSRRALTITIVSLIVGGFVARLATLMLLGRNTDLNAQLQYRLDPLLIGALLAVIVRNRTALSRALRFAPWTAASGLLGYLWICFGTPHEWMTRNTYTRLFGFPCLAVFFGSCVLLAWNAESTGTVVDRVLCSRFLQFTGKYSYGLYVFHAPIMLVALYSMPVLIHPWRFAAAEACLLGLFAIAVAYLVAYLSFNLYEKRFLTLKEHFTAKTRQHAKHPDFPERDRITA